MVTHWNIDPSLRPPIPILCGYHWDEHGFALNYLEVETHKNIRIAFHLDLDGFRIMYLTNDLEAEERLGLLMKATDIKKGPFIPFFIQSSSEFINEVKKMHGYDADRLAYLQYTMVTEDFWIEVVSSQPPTITITPAEDSK